MAEGIPDVPGGSFGAHSFLPRRLLHFIFLEGPGWIVSTGSPQVQAQGAIVVTMFLVRGATRAVL